MELDRRYKKYIILSSLLFVLVLFLFIILPLNNSSKIPAREKTQVLLKKMEKQDVSDINKQIQEAQKTVALNRASTPLESLNIQFQDAIIIGDSIGEGLVDYQILSADTVLAVRGLRINNCEEQIQTAISRAPSAIFLEFGMNDMGYWRGNVSGFIDAYKEKVETIQKALPKTKIYVNGILPIAQQAITNNASYASYPTFNEELKNMCKEKKINYIDNSFIINSMEVAFEFDGIHPKYEYYQKWAMNMAHEAGL